MELGALPARYRLRRRLQLEHAVHATIDRIDLLGPIDRSEQHRLATLELAIDAALHTRPIFAAGRGFVKSRNAIELRPTALFAVRKHASFGRQWGACDDEMVPRVTSW